MRWNLSEGFRCTSFLKVSCVSDTTEFSAVVVNRKRYPYHEQLHSVYPVPENKDWKQISTALGFNPDCCPVCKKQTMITLFSFNRRLAQFDQMFHSSNSLFKAFKEKTQYTKEHFEPADFYEKELEIDPGDQVAVNGILERIAWQLNYSIHELPEYELTGEFEHFESELQQFKRYLNQSNTKDKWKKRLETWDFVQDTWKDYIANLSKYESYMDYLRANHLSMD